MAGCILVDNEKIQVINRSPKYKNRYVHRRTSAALENLTPKEVSYLFCCTYILKGFLFLDGGATAIGFSQIQSCYG